MDAHLPEDRLERAHSFQPSWAEAEEVIREVSAGVLALAREVAEQVGNHGHASVDQRRTS